MRSMVRGEGFRHFDVAVAEIAREIMRRAVVDADSVDGWCRMPELTEDDYEQVIKQLWEFISHIDRKNIRLIDVPCDGCHDRSLGFDQAYAYFATRAARAEER